MINGLNLIKTFVLLFNITDRDLYLQTKINSPHSHLFKRGFSLISGVVDILKRCQLLLQF